MGKKSSCIQTAINAGNSMERDCLLHLMCSNYFVFLIHLSLLQRVRHGEGDNIPGKFLARWNRRNCGIKAAVKRIADTADYILSCKLSSLVNGWPWKYRMLSVIKLLICKKFCSKEAFSWLSSKTSFKGLICEMQDNMHLHISFLFR